MAIVATHTRARLKMGFALLTAVIFVSVILALGTALSSLGYKQQILAQSATRSQYAFYAADAALECALKDTSAIGNGDPYLYTNDSHYTPVNGSPPIPTCGGVNNDALPYTELCFDGTSYNGYAGACEANHRVSTRRFEIFYANPPAQAPNTGTLCADVIVFETNGKTPGSTYIYAQGYDTKCSDVATNPKLVTRGLSANF